ncbi:putative shikimate O-hydroxycinnamoyltransferase [Helianthus annuus]|nr:putative shikimate O-hydroxycinnamoyltransferase [Helianthus annuus]
MLRERIFHFSSDSLAKLKAKANSECGTTKISTLQSLSAVVWRCVTRAQRFPVDQETGCMMAVNNRSRLSPPVPENYFGNVTLFTSCLSVLDIVSFETLIYTPTCY